MKLDLSVLGDIVHERCNAQYYSAILSFLQVESESLGVIFLQKKSNIKFGELPHIVVEKMAAILTVARLNFLYKDIEFDTFLKWVHDDLNNGYGYKFLYTTIEALEAEKVFIHFNTNQNIIDDEYSLNEFIAVCSLRAGAIKNDDYNAFINKNLEKISEFLDLDLLSLDLSKQDK